MIFLKVICGFGSIVDVHHCYKELCLSKYRAFRYISRWYKNIMRNRYSSYISPHAVLDPNIKFPHPTGIVIGDGVVCADCTIYQNVTLGAKKRFIDPSNRESTYPKIGTGTVIYASAVIVGGVSIGSNSIVGANSFVDFSIPESTTVVGSPGKIISG